MEMLKPGVAGVLELPPHPARALQTNAHAKWRVLDSGLALVRRSSVRIAAPSSDGVTGELCAAGGRGVESRARSFLARPSERTNRRGVNKVLRVPQ